MKATILDRLRPFASAALTVALKLAMLALVVKGHALAPHLVGLNIGHDLVKTAWSLIGRRAEARP